LSDNSKIVGCIPSKRKLKIFFSFLLTIASGYDIITAEEKRKDDIK
jgi:hypothetical protein